MEKRYWASLNEEISLLGFGCMRFPMLDKDDPTSIDKELAKAMLKEAWEQGVNYFDTAYPYHNGASEAFLGEALVDFPRESYRLASKLPSWELVSSLEDAERIFNEQLTKCNTEYFDFYLMHSLNIKTYPRMEELKVYDFLLEQKRQGKIRHLGFSIHDTPETLTKILDDHEWDFVQIQLNYLDWEFLRAKEMYEILSSRNIPVVVMEPVRGGNLARLGSEAGKLLAEANPDVSQASWAVRFVGSLPGVMAVLSGMSAMDQVQDNLATFKNFQPLSESDYALLDKVREAVRKEGRIPCTGCRYCIDCPQGVNIARIFDLYNQYCIHNSIIGFRNDYRSLAESEQAHNCIQCGNCESHCPQGISIIENLQEIDKILAKVMGR